LTVFQRFVNVIKHAAWLDPNYQLPVSIYELLLININSEVKSTNAFRLLSRILRVTFSYCILICILGNKCPKVVYMISV
jgi:hypothetical protein